MRAACDARHTQLVADKEVRQEAEKGAGQERLEKQPVQVVRSALFHGEHPANLTVAQAQA